jgi:hypothetical protein
MFQQIKEYNKIKKSIFFVALVENTLNIFEKIRELEVIFVKDCSEYIYGVAYDFLCEIACIFEDSFVFRYYYINEEKEKVYVYETNVNICVCVCLCIYIIS